MELPPATIRSIIPVTVPAASSVSIPLPACRRSWRSGWPCPGSNQRCFLRCTAPSQSPCTSPSRIGLTGVSEVSKSAVCRTRRQKPGPQQRHPSARHRRPDSRSSGRTGTPCHDNPRCFSGGAEEKLPSNRYNLAVRYLESAACCLFPSAGIRPHYRQRVRIPVVIVCRLGTQLP